MGSVAANAASIVSAQQGSLQTNLAMSFIKKNAQAEESVVNMIAQSSSSGGRGQNVNLNV